MSSKANAISLEEDKWRAESDAETLIHAAEIKGDKKRLKAALSVLEDKKKATDVATASAK